MLRKTHLLLNDKELPIFKLKSLSNSTILNDSPKSSQIPKVLLKSTCPCKTCTPNHSKTPF